MGNMKPIDSAVVKNETYDVLSADTMGGEYIETIGAACQNPDGYTSGSLFLGKDNDVQHLYRATAAIAFGETIILDTNCTYTTVSGELEGKAEESEVTSLNEALTNEVVTRAANGAHNLFELTINRLKNTNTNGTWSGNTYTHNGVSYACTVENGIVTNIQIFGATTTNSSKFDLWGSSLGYGENKYKGMTLTGGLSDLPIITRSSNSADGSGAVRVDDAGSGCVIGNGNYLSILFFFDPNTSISGTKLIKPMIRLATDLDPTYTPYAKTNQELTQLGVYYHASDSAISLQSGAEPTILQIYDLPAGVYIASAYAGVYPAAECNRYLRIKSSDVSNIARAQGVTKETNIAVSAVVNLTTNNGIIALSAYQNSGNTITIEARLDIVRIG